MMHTGPSDERSIFNQFLDDFYGIRRALRGARGDVWQPPTDVYETESDIVIKVSIPGVEPGKVRVHCNGDVISICGVRKGPDRGTVRTYHQMEIRNGYFERRIAIHRPFDPRQAHGEYVDGFLYVFIPKAPEPVRHVVTIRLGL
jgi:HSP20 family protein